MKLKQKKKRNYLKYNIYIKIKSSIIRNSFIKVIYKKKFSGEGKVYKWSDFIHGLKGKTRVVIPSPCKPMAS